MREDVEVQLRLGPLSWRAWHNRSINGVFYTGGVYWRGKIVWTLTWWGL